MRKEKSNLPPAVRQSGLFDGADERKPVHPDLLITEEDVLSMDNANQHIITHGEGYTKFGRLLMAATEHGICRAEFEITTEDFLSRLNLSFTGYTCISGWHPLFDDFLRCFSDNLSKDVVIPLHLRGTAFQMKVWNVLAKIPFGARLTYSEVAAMAGRPDAVRAVGTAIGRNPVAWLVPCHRVVHTGGRIGQYIWGAERKRRLLEWEVGSFL
jgi:AraC family transcriptional regulator of adaptative response/methylated-DNA-[protein]-cysteine methyltransferase